MTEGSFLPSWSIASTTLCQPFTRADTPQHLELEPSTLEGVIEKHIGLQEAIEYLQHECLTNHFYITHFAGCAFLFNKDTFHSDIKVKSIYFHDSMNGPDQAVKEGQSGWVRQTVISRASFRRIPRYGKYQTISVRKRGIGKNLLLTVRTVMHQEQAGRLASDFNGAAWRRHSGSDPRPVSIKEEALTNACLPIPLGPCFSYS